MRQFTTTVLSDLTISAEWIREIKETTGRNVLFHIYSGNLNKKSILNIMNQLRYSFPDAKIVGTESGGEIKDGKMMTIGTLISCIVFDTTDIEVVIYDDLAGNERKIGTLLKTDIDARLSEDIKAVELLLPGALMDTLHMYEELEKCDQSVCIFGGYAGNHDADLDNAFVFVDGEIKDNAVIAVMYKGKDFHVNTSKSAGWQKLGVPFKITKADGNILHEINETPAAEIYKRYLNIDTDENFVNNTNEFPIAAYVDGEELLRHTNQLIDGKSLVLAGSVVEGWDMYLTYGDPTGIIDEVNERLKKIYCFDPQAILLYSCYVRKLFWERYANIELEPFQKIAPVAGFNTFGEVLRNMKTGRIMEYNITLLSIAMREGDVKEEKNEEDSPQADDTILRGQSSLVKRLAQLVSSSTAEIQKAYAEVRAMNKKLDYASKHDVLTGILNRGEIERIISQKILDTCEDGSTISVVMMDIDHFKQINDTYGHKKGDVVLKKITECLQEWVDSMDGAYVGRWGGEEFMAVLPDHSKELAVLDTEAVRRKINSLDIDGIPPVTISAGVFTLEGERFIKSGKTISPSSVFTRVDDALYKAKNAGRDCVKEAYTY